MVIFYFLHWFRFAVNCYMIVLIFLKCLDLRKNCYPRTASEWDNNNKNTIY